MVVKWILYLSLLRLFVEDRTLKSECPILNKVLIKMNRIHKNMGHPEPEIMVQICDAYDTGVLGFTKFEALIFQKHGASNFVKPSTPVSYASHI